MLKKSLDIINNNFLLIFLLTITFFLPRYLSIIFQDTESMQFLLLGLFFSITSLVLICGIFSSLWQYAKEGRYDFIKGIKESLIRYLGASICSAIMIVIAYTIIFTWLKGPLSMREFRQTQEGQVFSFIVGIPFSILLIYVFPYVFTKGEGIDAVIDGIKYILKNYKDSILPIIIVVLLTVTSFSVNMFDKINLEPLVKELLYFLVSFAKVYLMTLEFLIASFILNKTELVS